MTATSAGPHDQRRTSGGRSLCAKDFHPEAADFEQLAVEHMHVIRRSDVYESEDDGYLLRVRVGMGIRWVAPQQTDESEQDTEPDIKALIEADFAAEYQFADKLADESVHKFAEYNVSHHVWPYWREYLASQSERMRLPRVVLPTAQLPHHRHIHNAPDCSAME